MIMARKDRTVHTQLERETPKLLERAQTRRTSAAQGQRRDAERMLVKASQDRRELERLVQEDSRGEPSREQETEMPS